MAAPLVGFAARNAIKKYLLKYIFGKIVTKKMYLMIIKEKLEMKQVKKY